jgi:alpha-glucoside transport system substrate-binding protein
VSRTSARKSITAVAGISALSLFLAACGGDSQTTTTPATTSTSTTSSAPAATGDATSEGDSTEATETGDSGDSGGGAVGAESGWCDTVKGLYPDTDGTTVNLYTVITAPEDTPYIETFKSFTECTGATVNYEGSKEFEAQIGVRVSSGNPPDVAVFPQPGLMRQVQESSGAMLELKPEVAENAKKYFPEDWTNYGTINDQFLGIPNNADFKSLVWYSPKTFEAKGYTVPTNWQELQDLQAQIVAAGEKPWCIGIESGEATGWQLTDWLEEYVLRAAGPDVYDQWVSHEVTFSDPQIADALAQMGQVVKNPEMVNAGFGDVSSIASTNFNAPSTKILDGTCTLTRQAANFGSNYDASVTVGEDGDVNAFYLPPISEDFGQTVLGGGTFTAAFADRPEVDALMYYLTTPEYANTRAQAGNYISANRGLDPANVPVVVQKEALTTLQDPEATFRFDASDLMPAAVGADAEWKQFTAWITGQDDATTLANIDNAWPAE